jgi:hypothetical protein
MRTAKFAGKFTAFAVFRARRVSRELEKFNSLPLVS